MKISKKKLLIGIVGGFIALLAILGLIGNFLNSQEGSQQAQDDVYQDKRLDELRKRKEELDTVYEGQEEDYTPAGDEQSAFVDQGELSNFDKPSVEKDAGEDPDETLRKKLVKPSTEQNQEASPSIEETIQQVLPLSKPDPATNPVPERVEPSIESTARSDEASRQLSDIADEMATEEDVRSIKKRLAAMESKVVQLSEVAKEQKEDAEGDSGAYADVSADIASLSDRIATLEEREPHEASEAVEDQAPQKQEAQPQKSKPTRPSPTTLRRLYRLERIEGSTATLIGQNTGRAYTLREGGSLAYGGTLTRIKGDSVTLHWPNTDMRLAVFGEPD